ncbi:TetR/AcrR family transcriptional regulator [Liquorilactobacillus vini]|uniref:TetR/AcrR family transcriptional regulator n=2 Tax=Liquorilactobacillus vini TaxID=238015 RepID=UPI0002F7B904|nr:TetR/AcrR family transcriptional regulator [Liquorilactobacillus vini]
MQNLILDLYANVPETKNLTTKQLMILSAAIELFAKKGYANTSTSEIAAYAGVSEGSIFRRFKNKRQLLKFILDPLVKLILPDKLLQFSAETLNRNYLNLDSFVRTIIMNRIKFIKDNLIVLKIFLNEILYSSQLRQDVLNGLPKQFINGFNNQLNSLKSRQQIIDWPNREIFRFLFSTLFGYALDHYVLFPQNLWNENEEIDRLITYIVNGLSPQI